MTFLRVGKLGLLMAILVQLTAVNSLAQTTVDFNRDVRPIFNKHCTACHGGVKQAGDVSFTYRDRVLPPDGWIVEPGDPDASVMIERVVSNDPEDRMPPPEHGAKLSDEEIETLRRWIQEGASWSQHWAYESVRTPAIPNVSDPAWGRSAFDPFVLARLDDEGIAPARDERPERWLRRATLDLIGLPPSPDELRGFQQLLQNEGEEAYEVAVDRLLQSPAFGERWASVWLDQIRYADSKGLGLDAPRNIWKYRDWVIDAFNRDIPFDEFTIKQIAGDLLPDRTIEDLVATAAHRTTQSNEEGGTDDEEFRIAAVLDRVNTTWQTWQGVTFGCVQCHSHPYDPFEHDEYYKFVAFFNNTADADVNEDYPTAQIPLDSSDYPKATRLDHQIDELQRDIWEQENAVLQDETIWEAVRGINASTSNATQVTVETKETHDEFHTVDTITKNADITLRAPLPDGTTQLSGVRLTAMPLNPRKAIADSEWGFVLSHIEAELIDGAGEKRSIKFEYVVSDEPHPFYDPQLSLDPKSNRGFSAYSRIHFPRSAAFILPEPIDVAPDTEISVTLKHRVFSLGSFALVTRRGRVDVTGDHSLTDMLTNESLVQARSRLAELRTKRSKIRSTSIPVFREREQHLSRPTHVFVRGLFLTKEKGVQAATPASLPPLPGEVAWDRLALAHWLANSENPLTARVAVNRLWARVFGVGLVSTEEDFGSSGEPPSHPQLLDFLADRFQGKLGWSTKSLLRELLLSRTYRQSSKIRPELQQRDSNNRLLARGPRHRLPAEIVRDQALSLSGLLTRQMHGPPVRPAIPSGVWRPFASWDKWDSPKAGDPNRYRRSVYTYTKRSIPYPMFAAFDAPSREFCSPRRLRSNTPLQALTTLNDETFSDCAVALGERIAGLGATPRDQLRAGFSIVTCRNPDSDELADLIRLHESLAGLTDRERLTTVAAVLLNLDEVLTK